MREKLEHFHEPELQVSTNNEELRMLISLRKDHDKLKEEYHKLQCISNKLINTLNEYVSITNIRLNHIENSGVIPKRNPEEKIIIKEFFHKN